MRNKTEYIEIGEHVYEDANKHTVKRVKFNLNNKHNKNSYNDGHTSHIVEEKQSEKQLENSSNGEVPVRNKRDLKIRTVSLQDHSNMTKRAYVDDRDIVIKVIKATAMCAIALPALAVMYAFTSHSNKDVRQSLSSWFDSLNCENEELENVLTRYFNKAIYPDKDIDFLSRMGIPREKLVSWLLKEFSYNIRYINVSGNSATANIVSESNSLHCLFRTITNVSNSIDITNTNLDEIYKKIGESVLEKLDGSKTRKNNFVIKLEKIDNAWKVCDKDSVIFNLFVK